MADIQSSEQESGHVAYIDQASCASMKFRLCLSVHVSKRPMRKRQIKLERLMADFMAATTAVEKYLKQGRPLRPLHFESMCLTVSILQTFLTTWKLRYGSDMPEGKGPDLWFMNKRSDQAPVNGEKRLSAAVVLGRLGGLKGGKARAMKLSAKRRAAIARAAATARWAKPKETRRELLANVYQDTRK